MGAIAPRGDVADPNVPANTATLGASIWFVVVITVLCTLGLEGIIWASVYCYKRKGGSILRRKIVEAKTDPEVATAKFPDDIDEHIEESEVGDFSKGGKVF